MKKTGRVCFFPEAATPCLINVDFYNMLVMLDEEEQEETWREREREIFHISAALRNLIWSFLHRPIRTNQYYYHWSREFQMVGKKGFLSI